MLEEEGSVASSRYRGLQLSREVIKGVLRNFSSRRRLQTTFCSTVCAIRFEYFDQGNLMAVRCTISWTEADSLAHHAGCPLPLEVSDDMEGLVQFLRSITSVAECSNPGLPTPLLPLEGLISLTGSESSEAVGENPLNYSAKQTEAFHLEFEAGAKIY